jgi:HlyD family secretion protein
MANLMVRLVHVTPVSVLDGPPPRPEAAEEMPNSSTSADVVDRSQKLPNWELLTLNDLAQVEAPLLAATTRNAYQLQPHANDSPITSSAEPPERRSLLGVALSQSAAKTAVAAVTVSWVVARITRACARSLRNTAEMIVRPARQPDRPSSTTSNRRSIRGHLRFAIAAMVLLAGGMGGWAATTELSGAVIAMGQLVVDSNVKKIQHPFGGVIAELHVRDGDRVNAGEVLVQLDGTETRANLAIVSKALDQLSALQARDQAMRDGAAEVSFPPELLDRAQDPVIAELIKGERRLFDALISGANGRKAQLREQVAQFDEQTRGMQKQLEAKAEEIDWNAQELVGIRDLWKQKLIDFARVTTAERDAARLEGEHGALVSSIAELKGKIAETQLRILQVDEDMRTDVGKELADVRGKIAELVEKKVAAEDRLQRLEIRAPQSGIIHELEFHTVGGVIQPGATIMGVVPDGDALTAEIKIAPPEIDQLHVGQKAILRFLSFNQQTTPEVTAELTLISADVTADPKTGTSYYTARVKVVDDDTSRIAGLKLVAGMPVEVFVQTTPRTVVSYLARPIADQIERAFRER